MSDTLTIVVAALQQHLNSAELITLSEGRQFRLPVDHIVCDDGAVFSIQAGEMLYCSPRENRGPWSSVEVMTVSKNTVPTHWDNCAGEELAGYVPIEAVAKEIIARGHKQLTAL